MVITRKFSRIHSRFLNRQCYLMVVGSSTSHSPTRKKRKMKSGILPSYQVACSSGAKVTSSDMHCIVTTSKNKCRGKTKTRRRKNARPSPHHSIPAYTPRISGNWTQIGTNVATFFREASFARKLTFSGGI